MKQNFEETVNNFATDLKSSLEWQFPDIDFSQFTPSDYQLDIWIWESWTEIKDNRNGVFDLGWVDEDISSDANTIEWIKSKTTEIKDILWRLFAYVNASNTTEVTVEELREQAEKVLTSAKFNNDPRYSKMLAELKTVLDYDFKEEDEFINKLLEFNEEKYSTLENIIETEKSINREKLNEIQKQINNLNNNLETNWQWEFISETSDDINNRIDWYNQLLDKYNKDLFEDNNEDYYSYENALAKEKATLDTKLERLNDKINVFADNLDNASENSIVSYTKNSLLADATTTDWEEDEDEEDTEEDNTSTSATQKSVSCESSVWGWTYSASYKWLYVNENGKNYRLFEYLDEITWEETTKITDFDNDGDDDLVYQMWNQIYVKENLSTKEFDDREYTPRKMSYDSGYFTDVYWYADWVNWFRESSLADGKINFTFDSSTDKSQNNYRIEYYELIDRFGLENKALSKYAQRWNIIDAISDIDNITVENEEENFTIRKNVAKIDSIWSTTWLIIKTPKLTKINEDLANNKTVNVSSYTKLYSGKTNTFIKYNILWEDKTLLIPAWENVEFRYWVEIQSIPYWELYAESAEEYEYQWSEILQLIWMPLLPWTIIESKDNLTPIYNESNHLSIKYYDDSVLPLDFREYKLYNLIDLGDESDSYFVILDAENDLYYAKIKNFGNNIKSTYSNTIALSPQKRKW